MRTARYAAALAALLATAACGDTVIVDDLGDPPGAPRDLDALYTWVLQGFSGVQAVGQPAVDITWLPPTDWNDEVFRVYGKRQSSSVFSLIATVTSCTEAGCAYRDVNVAPNEVYEYYVATTDEADDQETSSDFRVSVRTPSAARPAAPVADSVTALDNALFLRWHDDANGVNLSRYVVYLTRIGGDTYLYHLGETDGTGFVDTRAENGFTYGYRIAAVDTMGHVSNLSGEILGVPRPDATAELVYAFQDVPAESGFRFQPSEATNPIVAGTSPQAQWRLESDASGWRIVPLNGTQVVEFPGRTTALACGPGADASCRAATRAPAAGYQTGPIAVSPEFSYVFRVLDANSQFHYGVVRVQLLGSDASGNDLMIFDWSYQTAANDPRLSRTR
ncbi:MAG TPA: hypothetical protein VFX98_19030 [Longimicrobiaceae bacterium]|nr:hypothetical protein [Longimicrobiaceae bacterium]